MANVPFHTHTFEIPTATAQEVLDGVVSDKVVVPSALDLALTQKQDASASLDEVAAIDPGATGLDVLAAATADDALNTLGFGAAGKAIAASSLAVDVRNYLDTAPYVATRTALKALDTTKDTTAFLTEAGREGTFIWTAGDFSAEVTADTQEGVYLAADGVASTSGAWLRQLQEGKVTPQMCGAAANDPGDGTGTIDTAAINAAIALAKAINGTVVGSGKYRIDNKVTFNWRCDFGGCEFIATGAATTDIAVEVSTGSASTPTDRLDGVDVGRRFVLPDLVNTAKVSGSGTWTGTGLRVVNAHNLDIVEGESKGFAVGYDYYAYQTSCAYNRVWCGFSNNNKIGRRIRVSNHVASWCNEIEWYAPRFYLASNEYTLGTPIAGAYFLYMVAEGGATYLGAAPNHHKFYGGSWEGNGPEYHIRCQGLYTIWHDIRMEASEGYRVRFDFEKAGDGSYNVFMFGRGVDQIEGLEFTEVNGVVGNKIYSQRGASRLNGAGDGKPLFVLAPAVASAAVMKGLSNLNSAHELDVEDTLYTWEIGDRAIGGKARGDAFNRVYMDPTTGRLYFGSGTATASQYIQKGTAASAIQVNGHWNPLLDNTYTLGSASFRWSASYATQFRPGNGTPIWTSGTGTPEGVVTAAIGSLFTRTDGGAATTLYIKESGAGNTGWVAK